MLTPEKFGIDRINPLRRPSQPFVSGHSPSMSSSNLSVHNGGGYASSIYAPSTMAASTIMPAAVTQPVKDTDTVKWVEGHCLVRRRRQTPAPCSICNERCGDDAFFCTGKSFD